MRRVTLLLAVFIAVFAVITIGQPRAQTQPRLLVVLVVDQMRADYLQRFDRHWRSGFRTLLDKGSVFDNARYPYLGTVTCAGHSTIGTGALPHTHGMISNGWWLRDEHRVEGCTADAASPDISYGRPARLGNSAVNLLVPTLADELRMQKPGARVVTMKERAALDDDTAEVLQANLTVIDSAIGESRAALDQQPESTIAQESLVEALRNKVALLQDTVALINATRPGDTDTITGLNQ